MKDSNIIQTIDQYISEYPGETGKRLQEIRMVIRKAAPLAEEKISYRMPAFTYKGMLVYFAAHTKHIGLYPFTSAIKAFARELKPYHTSKGGIQFPNTLPLPLDLIEKIIHFRVAENETKAELKKSLKRKIK